MASAKTDEMMNRQIQRSPMPEFDKIIRPKFTEIIENCQCNKNDLNRILDFLYQEFIIDETDTEYLESRDTMYQEVREFLRLLKYRGDKAYLVFVEALKKYNFTGILKILEEDGHRLEEHDKTNERIEWRMLKRRMEKKYVKTRAFHRGMDILKERRVLGIIGSAGDGKSILSSMIAYEFLQANPNYILHTVTQPDDCHLESFDDGKKRIIIIDDMLGKYSSNKEFLRKWELKFNKLKLLVDEGQLVMIYTLRDYIFNFSKYKLLKYDPFSSKDVIVDLHKGELTLNEDERMAMVSCHGVSNDESEQVMGYSGFGFPAVVENITKQGKNSNNHLLFLATELETLWKEEKHTYSALFMVFFLQPVDKDDLCDETSESIIEARETIGKIYNSFEMSHALDVCDDMSESFIRLKKSQQNQKIYVLNENVSKAIMLHLSKRYLKMALDYSPLGLLISMTQVEENWCQIPAKVYVPEKYYPNLSDRFLSGIGLGILEVFAHPAFLKFEFLESLLKSDKDGVLVSIKDISLGEIDHEPDTGNIIHFMAVFGKAKCFKMLLQHENLSTIVHCRTSLGKDCKYLIEMSQVESEKKVGVFDRWQSPIFASIGSEC